jgi:para-nitrobenzyl esterase
VLTESIGTALAAGHFGSGADPERNEAQRGVIFVVGLGVAVSGGTFALAPAPTADTYESVIASVLGVTAQRASAIAAEYPLSAYPAAILALSTLVAHANFACPALQVDRWTAAKHVPTFAYQFNDDSSSQIFAGPPIATHSSEIPYVLDQPNAPHAEPLTQARRRSRQACAPRGRTSQRMVLTARLLT